MQSKTVTSTSMITLFFILTTLPCDYSMECPGRPGREHIPATRANELWAQHYSYLRDDTCDECGRIRFPSEQEEKQMNAQLQRFTKQSKQRHVDELQFFGAVYDGNCQLMDDYLKAMSGDSCRMDLKMPIDLNREFRMLERNIPGGQKAQPQSEISLTALHMTIFRMFDLTLGAKGRHAEKRMYILRRLLNVKDVETGIYLIDVNASTTKPRSSVTNFGYTPLHLAVRMNMVDEKLRLEVIKELLNREDIDLTLTAYEPIRKGEQIMHPPGKTALYCAYNASQRSPDVFNLILDHADPAVLMRRVIDNGDTLLHVALRNADLALCEKLIDKAPGLLALRNDRGESPADILRSYGKGMSEQVGINALNRDHCDSSADGNIDTTTYEESENSEQEPLKDIINALRDLTITNEPYRN